MFISKSAVLTIASVAVLSCMETNAFSVVSSSPVIGKTSLHATIEETSATSSLVSPAEIEGSTSDLFEDNVQKTYG